MLSEENRVFLLSVLSLSMVEQKPLLHERLARCIHVRRAVSCIEIYCPPTFGPADIQTKVHYPLCRESDKEHNRG
jgi:hypothetical protein